MDWIIDIPVMEHGSSSEKLGYTGLHCSVSVLIPVFHVSLFFRYYTLPFFLNTLHLQWVWNTRTQLNMCSKRYKGWDLANKLKFNILELQLALTLLSCKFWRQCHNRMNQVPLRWVWAKVITSVCSLFRVFSQKNLVLDILLSSLPLVLVHTKLHKSKCMLGIQMIWWLRQEKGDHFLI